MSTLGSGSIDGSHDGVSPTLATAAAASRCMATTCDCMAVTALLTASVAVLNDSVRVSMVRNLSCKEGVMRTIVRTTRHVNNDHEEFSEPGS